ncbi:sensor histidine kinase [Phytoactinopolyspora endophytica]|uniref:sensor histidine kinase n=1 Tax=Phytoactinopolyspora endophytica TaxID=1642495 RepID=UPI00101C713C|nr:histidine kinase [Phytoactinopolyspora endophytica]
MTFTGDGARRVDQYNRISMYALVLTEPLLALGLVGNIATDTPGYVLTTLFGLGVVHTVAVFMLLRASFRYRLAEGPRPDIYRVVAGVITLIFLITLQAWREYLLRPDSDMPHLGYVALTVALTYYGGTLAAGMTARQGRWVAVAGLATLISFGWAGGHVPSDAPATTTAVIWAAVAVLLGSTFPTFVWISRVLLELDRSRQTQARLAVAEERLRFARDLHDVLGRNLSVVALKSELTSKLVRRDPDEAARQADEVRQLAESSLKEVRDVVRGYRATDLEAELAGSRSVLEAAGVRCAITSLYDGADLPADVQTTLAWVVREGTTNVLRHSDAAHCTITLGRDGDTVMLTMENDGVRRAPTSPEGSGLAGLRERVRAGGGTLTAGSRPGDRFRLAAMIPPGAQPDNERPDIEWRGRERRNEERENGERP